MLALDSDSLPGMSFSLGAELPPDEPLLNASVVRGEDNRWMFVEGVDPVIAAQRFSSVAPDGVRLLCVGKTTKAGLGPIDGAVNAFFTIVHHIEHAPDFGDWAIVGDLPAGGRQTALSWSPYARQYLLVVEPTWQSMLTARRIRRIAAETRPDANILLAVNKVSRADDADRVGSFLELPVLGTVPVDEGVRRAERAGVAVLDHAPDSAAVAAIARLAERLEADANISGPPGTSCTWRATGSPPRTP